MAGHISSGTLPERTSSFETAASEQMRRVAISEPLISSEKKSTLTPALAALRASERANDVLPTPGRAPTTLSEPGRMPINTLSSRSKPVATPAVWPRLSAISSISA